MPSTAAFTTSSVPHFAESGRVNPRTAADLMAESDYAAALDHLVLTCVDLVFLHQNQILLARRNRYPRKTWWVIGGRMVAGEPPIEAAQRKAVEEAGLAHLAGDRFRLVGVYSTSFAFREQAPTHHGSHTVNLTYLIELTAAEKAALMLTSAEYEADYQWIELDQVMHLIDPNDSLDQALVAIVHDVKKAL
ncbi:MAG: NUDIX domain-containing protein [Leptolyngbyaceae cyanobacterium bins.349]|nr:NUDIX domain-containing protein [Leptolyngbyaceae cyanobacterium bins.349]